MTTIPGIGPNVRTDTTDLDLERLQVAARAVLDWLDRDGGTGLSAVRIDEITRHARILAEAVARATPFAATRAHALTVRNELIVLATEQSLTFAVWFDDALGLGALRGAAVTEDPAELRG
ncbi:hypothetical protein ACQPX6_07035 [Actinomycetospora sp. CA-101289]|uniref:hypothetical protein n=1 Tax=Actinomycetospora sp. CA-101289 TaxID=3239893 RepID=UPI003D9993E8